MAKRKAKAKEKTEEEIEAEWDKEFKEPKYQDLVAKENAIDDVAEKRVKEEIKAEEEKAEEIEEKLEEKKEKEKKHGLRLYLYIFGEEFKQIYNLPKFEKPVTYALIQSIRGFRETIHEGRIDVNSSNENVLQSSDEEFEKHMNKVIEDEKEYLQEVQDQAIIENEFEEALAEQDRKGRERAQKEAEEEQKRLAQMKREEEEKRLKKQTTVSKKSETK